MTRSVDTPDDASYYPTTYVDQSKAPSQDAVAFVLHEGFSAICRHLADITAELRRRP